MSPKWALVSPSVKERRKGQNKGSTILLPRVEVNPEAPQTGGQGGQSLPIGLLCPGREARDKGRCASTLWGQRKRARQLPLLAKGGSATPLEMQSLLWDTHAGWAHGCWLQRRRMGLGLFLWSHRCRWTMWWSRRRRQPYLVNWIPVGRAG